MKKIICKDREGKVHELEAEEGMSVMEITRDEGMPVQAICGGNGICTTCHVYVDADWYKKLDPPTEDELALIEDSGSFKPTSRLGCQIPFKDDLDGMTIELAPEY